MDEPSILTCNVWHWTPNTAAHARRAAEDRHATTVARYLSESGFTVEDAGRGYVRASKGNVHVSFDYSETCRTVRRHLAVTRDGKRSNVRALRAAAQMGA